jgi:cyclopropane-fatty-acyl-phospholipid synthase
VSAFARTAIGWVDQGLVPDAVIRSGIRRLCESRLQAINAGDCEQALEATTRFAAAMDQSPVALVPERANEQHYEVPAEFFGLVLGPHRKYSSAWWPEGAATLADAETAALAVTSERAGLADGQSVLELGCGWGSLTLWMAAHYPGSRITAVSNSHSQRAWIESEAARRGLGNLRVVTADMNDFRAPGRYDRIVSVEMFEHMRNWRELFARVHDWLADDGRFFMHVFCHRDVPYAFEDQGPGDWMSRHFFTGGMMPSDGLALRFQDRLAVRAQWRWSGRHYEHTANAWLANLDARRAEALAVLAQVHGPAEAAIWLQRWRVFFMACAELFGYRGGQEWWVSHYLLSRRSG